MKLCFRKQGRGSIYKGFQKDRQEEAEKVEWLLRKKAGELAI
jgi:hypothetical protein